MKGLALAAISLLVAAVVQVTILPAMMPFSFRPDVMLAVAITWGCLVGYRQAVVLAVAGGFLVDVWSDLPMGMSGLLAGIASLVTIVGETPIMPSTVVFPLLLTFVGEVAVQLLRLIVLQAMARPYDVGAEPALAIVLLTAASSSLLVLAIYPIAQWCAKAIAPPRVDW